MTDLSSYIYLLWIGNNKAEEELLEQAKNYVARVFGTPAMIKRAAERPPNAFDPSRGQYSSTKILRWLLRDIPPDAKKIIGITDCDLYIPVLTFVFGEAHLGGKGAVVSTARLSLDLNGLPSPALVVRARLLKECVHELGHTFGLSHCSSPGCVMSRSNTVIEVDSKSGELCRDCRSLLKEHQKKE